MKKIFKLESDARDSITIEFEQNSNFILKIEPQVIITFGDDILKQEHFSYFDFTNDIHYNVNLYEKANGFEVEIQQKKFSKLVYYAEVGDLASFTNTVNQQQSQKALSLAFIRAIEYEKLNILEYYFKSKLIDKIKLYKNPLVKCTDLDCIESFIFFIRKDYKIPKNILGFIFCHNSIKIMSYLCEDENFAKIILQKEFISRWPLIYINQEDNHNESVLIFKRHKELNQN